VSSSYGYPFGLLNRSYPCAYWAWVVGYGGGEYRINALCQPNWRNLRLSERAAATIRSVYKLAWAFI